MSFATGWRGTDVINREMEEKMKAAGIVTDPTPKPLHARPGLYAYFFEELKPIAKEYGYNLVLHGSMNRDLDLIAIPWQEEVKPHLEMIEAFVKCIGSSHIMPQGQGELFTTTHHGRMWYVININRGGAWNKYADPQFYIDISVMPTLQKSET